MAVLNPGSERHAGFLLAIFFCVKHARGEPFLLNPFVDSFQAPRRKSLSELLFCLFLGKYGCDFPLQVCQRNLSTAR